jgi:hypothetical protein
MLDVPALVLKCGSLVQLAPHSLETSRSLLGSLAMYIKQVSFLLWPCVCG